MSNFRPIDQDTGYLLPPSVDEWLPEQHLARFVVIVIDGLDLRVMSGSYCCATIKVRIRDNQGENGFSGLS